MKTADPRGVSAWGLGEVAPCFVPCIFMRQREGSQKSLWERWFGVSDKSKNFIMIGRIVALPLVMKDACKDATWPANFTSPLDWTFRDTEDEIVVKTLDSHEKWRIEKLLAQFTEEVREKYHLPLRFSFAS